MEKGVKNIERTPCVAKGITDRVWDWNEMYDLRYATKIRTIPVHTPKNRLFSPNLMEESLKNGRGGYRVLQEG